MREESIAERILPDGREAVVYQQLFQTGRLVVGQPGFDWCEDEW